MTDDLRSGRIEIPPFPAVAAAVLKLAGDARADAQRLGVLVERDPALAAAVLRTVRSPAFAGTRPIATLQQAIARIGLRNLAEVVVTSCMQSRWVGKGAGPMLSHTWQHAVASADYARRISAIRRRHVEAAYLCGLMHSVGKLVLLQQSRDTLDPTWLSEHHPQVGLAAARAWQLPAAVTATIGTYRRYTEAAEFPEEAATTWLAIRLAADLLGGGAEGLGDGPVEEDPVLERLDLYPDEIETLRAAGDAVRASVAVLG